MSEHTKEPWHIDKYDAIIADGEILNLGATVSIPMGSGERRDKGKVNARRIVACVNACAGIPTEWLESKSELAKELPLTALAKVNNDLQQQRDELLAALEYILWQRPLGTTPRGFIVDIERIAKEAIAKIEGGA